MQPSAIGVRNSAKIADLHRAQKQGITEKKMYPKANANLLELNKFLADLDL
jgi:hypothetical protein